MKLIFLIISFLFIQYPLNSVPYRFFYPADKGGLDVHVAGSFNEWSATLNPMRYNAKSRGYEAVIDLEPGIYEYKFVVNGRWITDPLNRETREVNGFQNSVIKISPPEELRVSRRGDGKIFVDFIMHDSEKSEYASREQNMYHLTLKTLKNDVERVWLVIGEDRFKMNSGGIGEIYEYYFVDLLNSAVGKGQVYYFELQDGEQDYRTRKYYLNKIREFTVPQWTKGTVFYQIFPERFMNGDRGNDPLNVMPWGSQPTYSNFMGGDINGIIEKMDYLKSLGIEAIYLNPIFKANSNHKYNTTDYFLVDPHFGGNTVFTDFLKTAHKNGMRIILDGVFNHTGTRFFQFQDLVKNGRNSKYKDWYIVHSFPIRKHPKPTYECWWGFSSLPKLNTKNPAVQNFIISVSDYWLGQGIDGWRLDVANEVYYDFWRRFRKSVKSRNREAYIVGEIWGKGNRWLQGDMFDAVMNYRLRNLLIDFFVYKAISINRFAERLVDYFYSYPVQCQQVMFNLLSSHDIPRIKTVAPDREVLNYLITFMFTFPGAPVIYYGDEIGMEGGKDPDNRRVFVWNESKWDREIYRTYKKMIEFRKKTKNIFKNARFKIAEIDRDYLVCATYDEADTIYSAYNFSEEEKIIMGKKVEAKGTLVWGE